MGCVKTPGFKDRKASCIKLILRALRSLNRGSFHISRKGRNLVYRALVCIGWIFLTGCHLGKTKEVQQKGPLSQLLSFEIVTFFSPYEGFDEKHLSEVLIRNLQQIGRVELVESSSKNTSVLLVALGGYQQQQKGFIRIFSTAEVIANKFKMVCSVWEKDSSENQNLPYPVLENGKIFFKRDFEQKESSKDSNPDVLLELLITEFAKEYRLSNSESSTPVFYLRKNPIS